MISMISAVMLVLSQESLNFNEFGCDPSDFGSVPCDSNDYGFDSGDFAK